VPSAVARPARVADLDEHERHAAIGLVVDHVDPEQLRGRGHAPREPLRLAIVGRARRRTDDVHLDLRGAALGRHERLTLVAEGIGRHLHVGAHDGEPHRRAHEPVLVERDAPVRVGAVDDRIRRDEIDARHARTATVDHAEVEILRSVNRRRRERDDRIRNPGSTPHAIEA
jgi:hypothetical protein